MALVDWIWLIRIVIEVLRAVSEMSDDDLERISKLRLMDEKVRA